MSLRHICSHAMLTLLTLHLHDFALYDNSDMIRITFFSKFERFSIACGSTLVGSLGWHGKGMSRTRAQIYLPHCTWPVQLSGFQKLFAAEPW